MMPAFCNSCGAIFASGLDFDNAAEVSLSGCTAGPCPHCGGMGRIPDGVFNFIGNTIQILLAPQRTVDELSRLTQILHEARKKQQSTEAVTKKIREELPSLNRLTDLLPTDRNELYGFLALIVAVVALVTQFAQNKREPSGITINQVINQAYVGSGCPPDVKPQSEQRPIKPSRNEPCSCGSGKKYKKCCGAQRKEEK